MAKIRAKLKELRDADVRYISLVDRAATRIPFRVLKRDKEQQMGIDLTQVFKSDKSDDTAKPYVSALVVFAQKDEAAGTQVQDAITAHGFVTDRVQKSDEGETLVYSQTDQKGETLVVRLSDQLLVAVGNMKSPEGWIGTFVEDNNFLPDLKSATMAMSDQMDMVMKSETPQADAEAVLTSYAQYLNQMMVLPSACYTLNDAVVEIVQKCACEEEEEETATKAGEKPGEKPAKNPAAESIKQETEADKKKRAKNHPPAEMAPVDEEDDQKPPPEDSGSQKSEVILTALKGIETTMTRLASKLETVVTEQVAQKKVLDGVVQKADTLNTTLKATVTAIPVVEDRPAGDTRMRVQKDDDPRTGNFDTAFLRRRGR